MAVCPTCGQAVPDKKGIVCDIERGNVSFRGVCVHLTPTRMSLFVALYNRLGLTCTREYLTERMWPNPTDQPDWVVSAVTVHLYNVRRRLAAMDLEILTQHGFGWSLVVRKGRPAHQGTLE